MNSDMSTEDGSIKYTHHTVINDVPVRVMLIENVPHASKVDVAAIRGKQTSNSTINNEKAIESTRGKVVHVVPLKDAIAWCKEAQTPMKPDAVLAYLRNKNPTFSFDTALRLPLYCFDPRMNSLDSAILEINMKYNDLKRSHAELVSAQQEFDDAKVEYEDAQRRYTEATTKKRKAEEELAVKQRTIREVMAKCVQSTNA